MRIGGQWNPEGGPLAATAGVMRAYCNLSHCGRQDSNQRQHRMSGLRDTGRGRKTRGFFRCIWLDLTPGNFNCLSPAACALRAQASLRPSASVSGLPYLGR